MRGWTGQAYRGRADAGPRGSGDGPPADASREPLRSPRRPRGSGDGPKQQHAGANPRKRGWTGEGGSVPSCPDGPPERGWTRVVGLGPGRPRWPARAGMDRDTLIAPCTRQATPARAGMERRATQGARRPAGMDRTTRPISWPLPMGALRATAPRAERGWTDRARTLRRTATPPAAPRRPRKRDGPAIALPPSWVPRDPQPRTQRGWTPSRLRPRPRMRSKNRQPRASGDGPVLAVDPRGGPVPRASGDGPDRAELQRERGWTACGHDEGTATPPARGRASPRAPRRAGMDRVRRREASPGARVKNRQAGRTSGDGPGQNVGDLWVRQAPPRERGWSVLIGRIAFPLEGRPAPSGDGASRTDPRTKRAGLDGAPRKRGWTRHRAPPVRAGDAVALDGAPHERGWTVIG